MTIQGIVAAAIVLAALVAPASAQTPWPLPEGVKSIEVNGYPMAYQETGSGTPLVLVHGAMNDYRYWSPQIAAFAAHHHVIAVSLRHFYPERWDGKGDDFSIIQHADDLAGFIEKLNLGPVNLLGHSRGGAVVLNVARRHPNVIKTLMLADASGMETLLGDTPETHAMAAEGRKLREEFSANLEKGGPQAAIQGFVEALAGPSGMEHLSAEEKTILTDNFQTAVRPEGRPSISCDEIRKFDFPILLLNGEQSPKRYALMFQAMRNCIGASVGAPIIIPGAAHPMNRQNPQYFDAAVLGFLSGR